MSDTKEPGSEEEVDASKPKKNPVKKLTRTLLIVSALLLVWYVLSDRFTPYTDEGTVKGLAIPIYPRVSGYVTKINVQFHSKVLQGDTLFQLDQRPFVLAVKSAEANLDNTLQTLGAQNATVKSAAGRLGVAKAQLDRAQRNYDRVQSVLEENPGALSLADRDRAETSLSQAVEKVASAEADLEQAEQQLGISGVENAQYRAALVSLEKAQLDLEFSTILAPSNGVIESFNVDIGFYSQVGQPLAMFVSSGDFWIEASMKENNLSKMKVGNTVELAFDVEPGKVYKGRVRSIGYGVNSANINRGELPSPTENKGWLKDPQRFPVIIDYEIDSVPYNNRLGGQVDVVVYTESSSLLEFIAKGRIRINSYLSFLR